MVHKALEGAMTLFIMALVLAFVLMLRAYYFPPVVMVLNRPIHALAQTVAVGKPLTYEMDYCKSAKFETEFGEVHYTFLNVAAYPVPGMSVSSVPVGCHVARELIIVPDIPAGTYKLEMVRVYAVAFSRSVVRSVTQEFSVVAR